MKIAVIGGGISALSLSRELLRSSEDRDLEITVFEAEETPGGLCRTLQYGEFRFDYGPHNFHSRLPGFHASMKSLLGDRYSPLDFAAQVVFRDRFIPYPMSGVDVLKSIPIHTSLACALSFLRSRVSPKIRRSNEESFRDFIVKRFGSRMYEIYFGPFTQKVWGVNGEELSADFGRERIGTYDLWDLFKRIFMGIRQKDKISSENPFTSLERFYPPSGCGEVIDALLVDCLSDKRFNLKTSTSVTGLVVQGERITSVLADTEIDIDFVFSTISILDLCSFLNCESESLEFTTTSFLNLCIRGEPVFSSSPWVLFSDESVPFNRVSELGRICGEMTPEGWTSLILEFTGPAWSKMASISSEKLLGLGLQGLERYGLLDRSRVEDWMVIRKSGTHPLRRVGYKEQVRRLFHTISRISNLKTLGRQGTFSHMNMDACFCSACSIAREFLREQFGIISPDDGEQN